MSVELELTVLQQSDEELGYLAGLVVTDQMIVALGGVSNQAPTVLASSNARNFQTRKTPRKRGLRDIIAVADSIWACGEFGQLAVSKDHGATWHKLDTRTDGCLFGLALASDGALWVAGDGGYAARILGEGVRRIELDTTTRFTAVYAVRDDVVLLGADGQLRRIRDSVPTVVPCGATKPLTGLCVTAKNTWIVVGDGGFCARSPDGQWYSRAHIPTDADLESIAMMADGTLVVVGDRGSIFVSRDDGRTWQPIASSLGGVHLWSVERFGGGMLIGGDGGLVAKLAPPGDATWADRADVFGGGKQLDEVFAAGPEGFIENGLSQYLAAIAADADADEDQDADEDDDEDEDDDDDDAEVASDEDDDEDEDDEDEDEKEGEEEDLGIDEDEETEEEDWDE